MTEQPLPEEFLVFLKSVKGKRARIVIEHILEHEYITTDELETVYGYHHPPRAIRDVREQGVPIETFKIKNEQDRTIAAYRFGDVTRIRRKLGGRRTLPKILREELYDLQSGRCAICLSQYELRYLQIDHRIPYEVVGDDEILNAAHYMLLCGSCNRAKSWSCEHCENWSTSHNVETCQTCYWGSPQKYTHIATKPHRRLDVVWTDDEVIDYEKLKRLASLAEANLPDYVKATIRQRVKSLDEKGD